MDARTCRGATSACQETLSFYGETNDIGCLFRCRPGSPAAINATVELPFPMRVGVMTVMQDDRLISRVGLPSPTWRNW